MAELSLDLRRRVVAAYLSGRSGTYAATSAMFGIGEATVSRLLRRYRETGDVEKLPRGGNNPRRIDLGWLKSHAEAHPDARLQDRADAWEAQSGVRLHIATVSDAMRAIGWTHKKKRR